MANLETHEEDTSIWRQPGCHPGTAAADLRRSLGASGEPPWGLFLQQEALAEWAAGQGRWIERKDIRLRSESPGVEHEVIFDPGGQQFLKITQPGLYGHVGTCLWGKLELVLAKPLEYLDRPDLADQMFRDGTRLIGMIAYRSGIRILTAQPLIVGKRPEPEAIIAWMRSLGFVPVGRKTYWNAAEKLAIFDPHPGNVLRIPDGGLCPIDIVPCLADAQMISFMNERVKTWKPKH